MSTRVRCSVLDSISDLKLFGLQLRYVLLGN